MRDEVSVEGQFMRRVYDLDLVRSQNPMFSLSWTAMHPIDQQSPLYGTTPEALDEAETSLVVTLSGLDETVSQSIYSRYTYVSRDILWNMRFVDIVSKTEEGNRFVNYSRFHDVMPLFQIPFPQEQGTCLFLHFHPSQQAPNQNIHHCHELQLLGYLHCL